MVRREFDNGADDLAEAVVERPHGFVNDRAQGRGGLSMFVDHQAEVPAGTIAAANPLQHGENELAKRLLGRGLALHGLLNNSIFGGADRIPEHFGIEFQLVAEVIIDERDIDAGAGADFADGRRLKAEIGKNLSGRIDQSGAGVVGERGGVRFSSGFGRRTHLNSSLKWMFKSVKEQDHTLKIGIVSKREFQTEVNQLLHLIVHSLYSHPEIFLRELVSNASDALDKLKYLTLTEEPYKSLTFDPRIDLDLDEDKKTLIVSDTGIGMNDEDLESHLGTIARSGTKNFLSNLSGDAKRDSNLIGQFGVGFYSVFMVADKVEVVSRKAAEERAWRWTSDGKTGFEIEPAERATQGTTVTLYFNEEGKEYANSWKLREIIRKYSNHIAFPIFLTADKSEWDETEKKSIKKRTTEQINSASALWKRPKSELKDEDYKELYKTISGDWEDPLFWFHTKAEGTMEYTTLFYVPAKAPMDLYQADYKPGVKLYVKRVFITDDSKELMPAYLRFLRGIIDSEDLPLNVSREILQQNRILSSIRTASVKKVLSELKSIATDKPEEYVRFIDEYNRPLKEGLYSDFGNRDALLDLIRVKSSKVDGWTSLADVKGRMKEGQKGIYYITGGTEDLLRTSPLLEIYKKKDIEVLILFDEFDELVFGGVDKYQDVELKAVNKSSAGEDLKDEADKDKSEDLKPLLEKIKGVLGDNVKDVKASMRLADSPSCIVSDEDEPSMKMQQMLRAMGQNHQLPTLKPTLEINPDHEIVKKLQNATDESLVNDAAWLLLDQALLVEGLPVENPGRFRAAAESGFEPRCVRLSGAAGCLVCGEAAAFR